MSRDRTYDAHEKLRKALDRLAPEQGRVARGNARTAALAALRELRRALDAEYPSIPKAAPRKPKKLQPGHKVNRLRKRGYVVIGRRLGDGSSALGGPRLATPPGLPLGDLPSQAVADAASRLGVRLVDDPRDVAERRAAPRVWGPSWLVEGVKLGVGDDALRRMRKSKAARAAVLAEAMLTAPDDD